MKRKVQLGQAVRMGRPLGARAKLRETRSRASSWSMLWADELPQQFQSGSSMSLMPMASQKILNDSWFSMADVFMEQPGNQVTSMGVALHFMVVTPLF